MMRGLALVLAAGAMLLASAVTALDIREWETRQGAPVHFIPAPDLPIVDVRLTFDAGSARDDASPGLASLTSALLFEGSDGLEAGELARRFEALGARVDSDSGRDSASISLRSLSEAQTLNQALDHLVRVLSRPDFPRAALERVRERMIIGLRREQQSPSSLGWRAFFETAFEGHPYASPPNGTMEALAAMDRESVRRFHDRFYVDGNVHVAIVGDLSEGAAREVAQRLVDAFPGGEAPSPLPPVPGRDQARTVRIPFDAEQVHVITGQPALARGDDDIYAFRVVNQALGGGGLVSILAREMREERGLSYSSYSAIVPMAAEGPFVMGTQVRSDALDEALSVLRGSLARLRADGLSEDELEDARRNITGGFPLGLASNRDLVSSLAALGFHELGTGYLDGYVERIEAVSQADAREVLRRRVDPDAMVTVLVGPESAIAVSEGD